MGFMREEREEKNKTPQRKRKEKNKTP